jgi:hypothetical protein
VIDCQPCRIVPGMHDHDEDIPLDRWIRVSELAATEGVTRREVYAQLDAGMRHSRIGSRIRVRRADWARWHERHLVGEVA